MTAEELEAIKSELARAEEERDQLRNKSKYEQEQQEMQDALRLAGMKSKNEKLLDLAAANPAKYHELKEQQLERDSAAELLEGERREQEKHTELS